MLVALCIHKAADDSARLVIVNELNDLNREFLDPHAISPTAII